MARPEHLAIACTLILSACMPQKNLHPDIHGHRGCRGLEPENSLAAFRKATELGCDYLELDVVMSSDGQVIVSHEPWMRHDLCRTADADSITPQSERSFNLYTMTADEIRRFDCGSIENPAFPEQDQHITHKPTLAEVLEIVDEHALLSGVPPPSFNIEIKSDPALYGIYQPQPREFVLAVIAAMDSLGITDRCMLQSFDAAVLEVIHVERPEIAVALLVESEGSLDQHLDLLSFTPDIYCPHFSMVDEALLSAVRAKEIELVVWTVNEPRDIRRMLDLGVDGIISDYPDRAIRMLENRE